jgi:hypothetical protein
MSNPITDVQQDSVPQVDVPALDVPAVTEAAPPSPSLPIETPPPQPVADVPVTEAPQAIIAPLGQTQPLAGVTSLGDEVDLEADVTQGVDSRFSTLQKLPQSPVLPRPDTDPLSPDVLYRPAPVDNVRAPVSTRLSDYNSAIHPAVNSSLTMQTLMQTLAGVNICDQVNGKFDPLQLSGIYSGDSVGFQCFFGSGINGNVLTAVIVVLALVVSMLLRKRN